MLTMLCGDPLVLRQATYRDRQALIGEDPTRFVCLIAEAKSKTTMERG